MVSSWDLDPPPPFHFGSISASVVPIHFRQVRFSQGVKRAHFTGQFNTLGDAKEGAGSCKAPPLEPGAPSKDLFRSSSAHSASVALRSASAESTRTDMAGGPCTPAPLRCDYRTVTMDSATAILEVPVGSSHSDSLGDACRRWRGEGGADSYLCSTLDAADSL